MYFGPDPRARIPTVFDYLNHVFDAVDLYICWVERALEERGEKVCIMHRSPTVQFVQAENWQLQFGSHFVEQCWTRTVLPAKGNWDNKSGGGFHQFQVILCKVYMCKWVHQKIIQEPKLESGLKKKICASILQWLVIFEIFWKLF